MIIFLRENAVKNRDLVEESLGSNTLVGLSNILEASPKVSAKQVRSYKFILTLSKLYPTVFWNVFPPHRKSLNQLSIYYDGLRSSRFRFL